MQAPAPAFYFETCICNICNWIKWFFICTDFCLNLRMHLLFIFAQVLFFFAQVLFIRCCGELVVCCLSVLYRHSYTALYVTIPCCPYTMSLLQYRILWGDLHSRFLKNNYFILEENFRRVQLPSYKFLRFVLRRNHFFLLRMYIFCQVNSSMW